MIEVAGSSVSVWPLSCSPGEVGHLSMVDVTLVGGGTVAACSAGVGSGSAAASSVSG